MTTKPIKTLPYGRQWIEDGDVAAVTEQLHSDWLTQGPKIADFEAALADTVGAKYAVAVSSGTAALHLACLAAGIGPGDAGITSAITFVASANCFRYSGARPFLADVETDTGLIETEALARAAERLAQDEAPLRAIIPVDLTGQPADLPEIQRIARLHGAIVIEDMAHSLGASYEYQGRTYRCGDCAHADMAALSFHPVKQITTGEGGAITTNDETLFRRLLDLRTHGIVKDQERLSRTDGPWYYEQQALGFNYRITDMQCALGLSQIRKLDQFVARRREIATLYDQWLKESTLSEFYEPLRVHAGRHSSYHLYVIRVRRQAGESNEELNARRRKVFEELHARSIRVQVHYIPVHWQPDFQRNFGMRAGDFPHAEDYYAGCLSLPMFPLMTNEDVGRVMDALGSISLLIR